MGRRLCAQELEIRNTSSADRSAGADNFDPNRVESFIFRPQRCRNRRTDYPTAKSAAVMPVTRVVPVPSTAEPFRCGMESLASAAAATGRSLPRCL